MARKDAP